MHVEGRSALDQQGGHNVKEQHNTRACNVEKDQSALRISSQFSALNGIVRTEGGGEGGGNLLPCRGV